MIDTIGFKHRPGKFLGNVIFLVGDASRGQYRKAVRPIFGLDLTELTGDQVKGLIPGGFTELSVFLNQR